MNMNEMKNRYDRLNEQLKRMTNLMESDIETEVKETSLSRVWSFGQKYDIASITSFRKNMINCLNYNDKQIEGKEYSKKENIERNRDLYAFLLQKGYGVTKVKGSYIENFNTPKAMEVSEDVYFVINNTNDPEFFETMIKLGKYFCQDSVLLKPKEGKAYLYGTNNSEFPGIDQKYDLGDFKGGNEAEFMTRIGKSKRPFVYAEDFNVNSRKIISDRSKRVLSNL